LFRPTDPTKLAGANPESDAAAVAQASRIVVASGAGEVTAQGSMD